MSALSDIYANLSRPAEDPRREPDDEAFGQQGIRQYLGPIVSWLCLIAMTAALTFWYRSDDVYDRLEWRGTAESLRISSLAGRIVVESNTYPPRGGKPLGWMYRGGPLRRVMDGWEPSVLKTIGIEFTRGPTRTDAIGGFILRIKWYFIAGLLAIVPVCRGVIRVVRQIRRRDEDAAGEASA